MTWTCTTCGAVLANPAEVQDHYYTVDLDDEGHDHFRSPGGVVYKETADGLNPLEPQPAPEAVTVDLRQLALAI